MTQNACRAKDPRVCPYHGAILRMEAAQKSGDFGAYMQAREEMELRERKGWNEPSTPVPASDRWDRKKEQPGLPAGTERVDLYELTQHRNVYVSGLVDIEGNFQEGAMDHAEIRRMNPDHLRVVMQNGKRFYVGHGRNQNNMHREPLTCNVKALEPTS